jgi:hypothetical protein
MLLACDGRFTVVSLRGWNSGKFLMVKCVYDCRIRLSLRPDTTKIIPLASLVDTFVREERSNAYGLFEWSKNKCSSNVQDL